MQGERGNMTYLEILQYAALGIHNKIDSSRRLNAAHMIKHKKDSHIILDDIKEYRNDLYEITALIINEEKKLECNTPQG